MNKEAGKTNQCPTTLNYFLNKEVRGKILNTNTMLILDTTDCYSEYTYLCAVVDISLVLVFFLFPLWMFAAGRFSVEKKNILNFEPVLTPFSGKS